MLNNYQKFTIMANRDGQRQITVRADGGNTGSWGNSTGGMTGGMFSTSAVASAIGKPINIGILEGLVDVNQDFQVRKICRDIYHYDAISGSVVDLMSLLPFSDLSLGAVEDQKILEKFYESCEEIRIKTIFPGLTRTFLTDGAYYGTLIWDEHQDIFTSIIPHDLQQMELTFIPGSPSQTPVVTLNFPAELKKILTTKDPRIQKIVSQLPSFYREGILRGKMLPTLENSLYIPRKSLSHNPIGTSILARIMPIHLLEKALLRGTIELAYRRQRGIMHAIAGGEDWEPTNEELSNISSMILQADMDPLGAVIATRPDISVQELPGAGDFWKVTDVEDYLTSSKLRAFGASEAFLAGDANFAAAENTLTVFTQNLKLMREYLTRSLFYEKLFPYISIANNFKKTEKSDIYGSRKEALVASWNDKKMWKTSEGQLQVLCGGSGQFQLQHDYNIRDYQIPVVTWHNCLVGNSLVATEFGLVPIDSIAEGNIYKPQDIDLRVIGHDKIVKAKHWVYNGKKQTIRVFSKQGRHLSATLDHQFRIFDPETFDFLWREARKLEDGDLLCIPSKSLNRKDPLLLNLTHLYKDGCIGGKLRQISLPKQMTPDLAWLLGVIVAEGWMGKHIFELGNCNLKLINHIQNLIQKIFNISCEYEIRKANYYPNSNILYRIRLGSMAFISALKDLGLVQRNGEKKRAARYKQVPWSILQADQNCQMAYLAGYIEGDGHINDCSIKIYSTSSKNLRQMQMMLGIYGLFSDIKNITLSLSKESSFYLAQKAKSYFISKFLPKYDLENLNSQSVLGIPTKGIGELLRSRKDLSKANSAGQSRYYFNDSGKSTFIRNSEVVSITLQTINFTYTKYQQGVYDEFLKIVKKVSPSFHQKIIFALEAKMFFDPIKKLKLGRRNHVYDLVIEKSEKPAFVANGILVHNSMRPEGDSEYFARLQELQQGGIPIPIRYLATAVGIDLEDIIHGIPEDLKIRESINEYLQQIQKFSGALGTGTANPEQQNFLSSLSSLLNNGLPKTKRDFDTEKYGPRNEINGKRYILTGRERKRQEEKANKNMAQTIARVAKKLNGQDHGEQLVLPLNELRRNDGT